MRSYFIVLEGIDGCGKGTIATKLVEYLFRKNKKYSVILTREPTYGKYGARIRQILAKEKDPIAGAKKCFYLYVKDRKDHSKKLILPLYKQSGNIIISDRYYHSTVAFQHVQGNSMTKLIKVHKKFLKPDLTIILDLPAKKAIGRCGGKEKFEELNFLEKVRKVYLKFPVLLDENILIINADQSKAKVLKDVKIAIDKLIY